MVILLDVLIAVTLLVIALRALFAGAPFTGAVLYIAFGLLMALVWARLRAPDIALAEAAIGAGITGALLIDATRGTQPAGAKKIMAPAPLLILFAVLAAAGLLAVLADPSRHEGLAGAVAAELQGSGVEHPVTAVLLNFRAYDTWLEIGVLLLAVLAAYTIRGGADEHARHQSADELIDGLVALLVPVLVLVSGLLLWLGTHAPGGAFQAGAVVGSGAVVMLILSRWSAPAAPSRWHRLLLAIGFAAFLVASLIPIVFGRSFLELRGATAGTVILFMESALTLSIGTALALLFAAARASSPDK